MKTADHAIEIGRGVCSRPPEVEDVPALPPLIERTELRSQELVQTVCRDRGGTVEPPRPDFERSPLEPENVEVLAGVDLDLQTERQRLSVVRGEAIDECHAALVAGAL